MKPEPLAKHCIDIPRDNYLFIQLFLQKQTSDHKNKFRCQKEPLICHLSNN